MSASRCLLIAVDDTPASEKAVQWTLENFYRTGDEVHLVGGSSRCSWHRDQQEDCGLAVAEILVNVVPRLTIAAQYGAPPVDLLPQQDPHAYETLLKEAEEFVKTRFMPHLRALLIEPIVHLIKSEVDNDAIGRVICKKADDLNCCAIIMAKRKQARIKEFFMGSVCKYCVANASYPVIVIH